mmetsp:Transcript_16328/g.27390  ORF Transcript_16328/g.27390 Transcript_16328/m.27390 type:complete len:385 (+) Transcript_16328:2-1156(+)
MALRSLYSGKQLHKLPMSLIHRPASSKYGLFTLRDRIHRKPSLVQKRTFTAESLPTIVQTGLVALQSTTGAPWWATIAMSTIITRSCLFPLVRSQILASRKLTLAMPEINFLFQLLLTRMKEIKGANSSERSRILSVFFKGVNACLALHNVSKIELIAYPFVNIGIFMTFVYSVRDMLVNKSQFDFTEGGLLWFADLSMQDSTFALPFTALSLSYFALELGFALNQGRMAILLKDVAMSLMILSVPFVAVLPAGVFCYWIPSSLFAIAQIRLIRSPYSMSLLRIPAATATTPGTGTGIGTASAPTTAATSVMARAVRKATAKRISPRNTGSTGSTGSNSSNSSTRASGEKRGNTTTATTTTTSTSKLNETRINSSRKNNDSVNT